MANPYCSITQLRQLFDSRTVDALSSDDGSGSQQASTLQLLLDTEASELESYLNGRYGLPLAQVPPVLTKVVGSMVMRSSFMRRSDVPKGAQAAIEWVDKWLENFIAGRVNLPRMMRTGAIPTISHSGALDGSSRFDNMPLQDQSGGGISSRVDGGNGGILGGF